MWRYRCKSQLITLAVAFVVGVLFVWFASGDPAFMDILLEALPLNAQNMLTESPWIVYLSGGVTFAGICNIFLLAQLAQVQFSFPPIVILMVVFFFPQFLLPLGIFLLPFTLVLSIYGVWSLSSEQKKSFRARNIKNAQELVRIYTLHHPLDEAYREMAQSARRNIMKIRAAYILGIAAVITVVFLSSNMMISLIVIFFYMFALSSLNRTMQNCFQPIAKLLYEDCNPEACMSALIYYGQNRNQTKVSLANPSLMAECMIYLNDPSLAQDFLILYKRNTPQAQLRYWNLMAYTYYMLSDEGGLVRCKESVAAIKPGFAMGSMGMMMKNEVLANIENRIRLMNGDFYACKTYFLEMLKRGPAPLYQAECDYYIALISFVQEDYSLAQMYFQKTVTIGGSLYFVAKAQNYLSKIDGMNIDSQRDLSYTPASYDRTRTAPPASLPVIDAEEQSPKEPSNQDEQ